VPRGAGRKLAGMERRDSSDSLQVRVLTLWEADLRGVFGLDEINIVFFIHIGQKY
jgi:hypothetical protein